MAQTNIINGKVTSTEDRQALPGVSVSIKGTQRGVATNSDGAFSIAVPPGATLVFSFIGYAVKEVSPKATQELIVTLDPAGGKLNDVVVLGYGSTQKRKEQTGAYSTLSGKEVLKAPVSDITNSLIGKISGVITRQPSGVPGDNAADIYIRGRSSFNSAALYVVDGVERQTFGNIDANEIESISVLKDASATALYGIKAGNGVIVITTKSGREGKTKVSYSGSTGLVSLTGLPETLNAFDAVTLMTEGENNLIKAGLYNAAQRTFTDAEIPKFQDGSDPLLYPDVNWYKAVTKKNWLRTQHNLNFSGGTRNTKYFVSMGYLFEDGMYKDFGKQNGYRTSNSFTRYNFRSNLDFNISKTTSLSLKLSGRLEDRYGIRGNAGVGDVGGTTSLISRILAIPAWAVPFNPEYTLRRTEEERLLDDTYNRIDDDRIGVNTFNPYSQLTRNGYFDYTNNAIESVIVLGQKLDFITKGLSFKGTLGLDAFITGVRAQAGSSERYKVDRATRAITKVPGVFNDQLGGVNTSRSGYNKSNIQLGFNYNRVFNDHSINVISLAQRELRGVDNGVGNAPFAYQGVVLSTKYNFRSRYFVEFNASYNGSENFIEGGRYGFFPAVSAGYNLSEEPFMKNIAWLDFLKIRGSYGKTGYSNSSLNQNQRFLYLSSFTNGGGNPGAAGGVSNPNNRVLFGNGNASTSNPVVFQSQFGNEAITWENSLKRNVGFEANLFRSKLKTSFDIFDERRYDILYQRNNSASTIYGQTLPFVNYGENYNKGFEIELNYYSQNRGFNYGFNLQYSHYANEYVILDQAASLPEYQNLIGERLGQYRGYKFIGFYQDAADIAKSPVSRVGNPVIPGDLKYQDTNGDNVIDNQDRVPIGGTDIPQDVVGFEPTISYKGISISALFQASLNVSSNVIALETGRYQYFKYMQGRWQSPADNETASWPVLKPTNYSNNPSYQFNSFLQQDASYAKLRNVEVAYQLPASLISSLKIQSIRIFFTGQNLYTWTKFKGVDPEIANKAASAGNLGSSNIYPLSKVFNFGMNIQF